MKATSPLLLPSACRVVSISWATGWRARRLAGPRRQERRAKPGALSSILPTFKGHPVVFVRALAAKSECLGKMLRAAARETFTATVA